MKQAIIPFLVGALVTFGGFFIASKVSGCGCFPKCLCSTCSCCNK